MLHTIKLALVYLRVGMLNELQYRVNFFIQILQSIIGLAVGLIGLWLVFSQTTELNGWTQPELLAVMGVFILMGGVIRAAIQPNMMRLLDDIQEGTLDFALTKPADAQVIVSVREFRLWQMVDVVLGLVVLGVAIFQLQENLTPVVVLSFLFTLLMGAIMVYCFWLILTSIAFWIIRVYELVNLFEGLYAAGRWPVSIYPNWLRFGLTFLVPVAFAVTIPAEALTGRLTVYTLLGAAGLAILLLVVSRLIWRLGVRNYSGASA
jgi:ABC-2 type transport system permease protein